MKNESIKRFRIYEYIRDSNQITSKMSNTKNIILKLINKDKNTVEFCYKKIKEEKEEVEQAIKGIHFHKNMTKREILVNEISQYIYWITILAISKKVTYEELNIEERINMILRQIDISKLGEEKDITFEEIIRHDLEEMKQKEYLKPIINNL